MSKDVRLIHLARPDFERWHAEEMPKHEAWKKLDAEALAYVQAQIKGKSPEAREAWLQGYARKKAILVCDKRSRRGIIGFGASNRGGGLSRSTLDGLNRH